MAQLGFAKQWGWKPPKAPGNYANVPNASGGITAPHPKVPAATPAGALPGTFNPEIGAKLREEERGAADNLGKLHHEEHFAEHGLLEGLKNIRRATERTRSDLNTKFGRDNENVGNSEADTRLKGQRTQEDFTAKREEIARQFGELAHRQGEAANASGVNDQGTSAAAAAARARNQEIATKPIGVAEGRLGEDLVTALGRLGTQRTELSEDHGTSITRLDQNRDQERKEAKNAYAQLWGSKKPGGFIGMNHITEEEIKEELANKKLDALSAEVYEGRTNYPGAYKAAGEYVKPGTAPPTPKKKGKK